MAFDYDLFVIGGGSGGVRASRVAAAHGARVAVAEEYRVGGTCVIRGCVPKKLMVYASHFAEDFEDAAGFGWQVGERRFSWPDLIRAKDQEIDRLNRVYLNLLENAGVRLFEDRGVFEDPHTIRVGESGAIYFAVDGQTYGPAGPRGSVTSNLALSVENLTGTLQVIAQDDNFVTTIKNWEFYVPLVY